MLKLPVAIVDYAADHLIHMLSLFLCSTTIYSIYLCCSHQPQRSNVTCTVRVVGHFCVFVFDLRG